LSSLVQVHGSAVCFLAGMMNVGAKPLAECSLEEVRVAIDMSPHRADRVLACEQAGIHVDDRQTVAEYLEAWLEIKQRSLKPTYAEPAG
jgi:hypothetical protein